MGSVFAADEKVLIDRLSQSEAEDLEIEIPDDVPPGFHIITIEVYDDNGTVSQRDISFCKDEEGIVQWDNNCPNLVLSSDDPIEDSAPSKYDPMEDRERSKGIQAALFAILAAITATRRGEKPRDLERTEEEESWQSVAAGALKIVRDDVGWGDRSWTWRVPFTARSDAFMSSLIHRVQRRNVLIARVLQDGDTLRAIFGSLTFLLPIAALPLGIFAGISTGFEALAPAWFIVVAIITLAVFNAAAGFVAGMIYLLPILILGNITSRPEWLTALGVLILCFAPALLASAFRPMRRFVHDGDEAWERVTDYAIAILLTFWTVKKMVEAMDGLARLDLPITDHSTTIATISALALFIRIGLEDIVIKHYPARLKSIYVQIEPRTVDQQLRNASFRTLTFILMVAPFSGSEINLALGALIFAIPQFTSVLTDDRLPKFNLYLPRGLMKTVVMIFVMFYLSRWIEGLFDESKEFLKWNFVVMALPGFAFHYLYAMDRGANLEWRGSSSGRALYRLGGIVIFLLMVQVVRGVDLLAWLK